MGIRHSIIRKLRDFADKLDMDNPLVSHRGHTNRIGSVSKSSSNFDTNAEGLNISVYSANGGKIIQTRSYDNKTDRTRNELYIVINGEDLAEELAQIITRESLTR